MVRLCVVADEIDVLHEWLDVVDPLRFHFNVVAQAHSIDEVRFVERSANPDVWVCRYPLAAEVFDQFRSDAQAARSVIGICGSTDEAAQALEQGINAVILDGESLWIFASAVQSAHRRQFFVSPAVLERYRSGIVELVREPDLARINELTGREIEVLQLVARGLSNAAISRLLFVSSATVSTHVLGIFRKLDVSNRTEAALFAFRNARVLAERMAVDTEPPLLELREE
ncbi:hypothetical protein ALI44B_11985 [Leifsonia sp. ALI-44-B]|jgi:two-component system response regulator DegU|uniref:helix-turn-helix transcriptional regulator n=1 Tax=Leifsonia sp. ALI-44-B TaxID=1933776 RepID=UPI00097C5113|nr:response regulator transcription factor [Leifsonia sp. ALI-44-B]ONI61192.1 hypothetical protein ALI44B_11985 [Leifsonia sp. ALI-44-B]